MVASRTDARRGFLQMIVCSCNVLTDRDVRAVLAGEQAVRTTGEVYTCLGCSAQCGRCARTIRRIMDEALVAAGSADSACAPCCHADNAQP